MHHLLLHATHVSADRTYTMWLPEASPAFPHPMPEFVAPMWHQDGTLTHYICMFGHWDEKATTAPGDKPKLTCMQVRTASI
jgi:hypothetical protein